MIGRQSEYTSTLPVISLCHSVPHFVLGFITTVQNIQNLSACFFDSMLKTKINYSTSNHFVHKISCTLDQLCILTLFKSGKSDLAFNFYLLKPLPGKFLSAKTVTFCHILDPTCSYMTLSYRPIARLRHIWTLLYTSV